VATIFLDPDLKVKRYTERAAELIRLIPTDIGRPLADLVSNLEYDALMNDCAEVLRNLAPSDAEVRTKDGVWQLNARDAVSDDGERYRRRGDYVRDVDRVKRAEQARDLFDSIVQTVREPLVVLDPQLNVVRANDAFYRVFDTEPRAVEGVLIYDLGNRQWDIPELRRLLEEILPADSAFVDFRVAHTFPRIGPKEFILNARRLRRAQDLPDMILLAFEDVTESAG